jgi:cyclase
MPDFTLQEVITGVNIAFGGICNRGIITSKGSVLVIDAGINAAEASPLREAAQQFQQQGPLMLFNTHPHGDHVYGNQVFADCTIIAQKDLHADLVKNGEQTIAAWKQRPGMGDAIKDVVLTIPTVTFDDKLTVFVGDIEVQLIHFGIAHSPSDTVAWLPQFKILFTGDLLFNTIVPVLPPGSNSGNWVHALEQLQQIGAEHVIPGHGPVQAPSALEDLHQWLLTLRSQVSSAISAGLSREATIEKVAPEMQKVAPRNMEERLTIGIGSVYDELSQAH